MGIGRIQEDDYLPSEQDVLRCRVRTTGIVQTEFDIDGNIFQMYDVGGQRNERKKWIHCFEEVTAVLFVGAVSAYDMVLYEDNTTNRVVEAVGLFDEICNSRWFKNTDIILFLNKKDLFEEKIMTSHICDHFPEFTGPKCDPEAGAEFITNMFLNVNKTGKKIIAHVVVGVDSENVGRVFNGVKQIILGGSMGGAGMM